MPMLERHMPILSRPLEDTELQLGAKLITTLMEVPDLTDQQAEVALAVALAMYVKHRELMGDNGAKARMFENVDAVKPRLRFKSGIELAQELDLSKLRAGGL